MKRIWSDVVFPSTCFVLAMASLTAGEFIFRKLGDGALPVTLMFYALSAVPLAVSFYRMRRKHRLWYGLLELAIACGLFYATMLGIIQTSSIPVQNVSRILTFMALLYFMVRALDNIGEGLKPGSTLAHRWERIFPKQ
jgi:hypothetical protein